NPRGGRRLQGSARVCVRRPPIVRAPGRGAWPGGGPAASGLLLLLPPGAVAALEALDAAARVDQLLLAGEEGMALVAELDVEVGLRGTGGERVAARTLHGGRHVLGMDVLLHDAPKRQASGPWRSRRGTRRCSWSS